MLLISSTVIGSPTPPPSTSGRSVGKEVIVEGTVGEGGL
jgi:hypothetical protein